LAVALWLIGFLYGDGSWSLERTDLFSIPINMHGTVVYLSPWQKFIYYDAFQYCLWIVGILIAFQALLRWRSRRDNAGG
jgi:hypothetical protein